MAEKFIVIGERIHCISPTIRKAMDERDPEPIIKRAKEQIDAGADYIDVNIGPAENDGPERMQWAVKLIQENCDNIPLSLDTANKEAIAAGCQVYNRSKGKPIVNSADAGDRIEYIDIAAENDAIVIALCSKAGVPSDNDERNQYLQEMLERGMGLGMDPQDMWFDPLFLVAKGMQDKQQDILEFIGQISAMGLNSSGGLSNVSNGMPKNLRTYMDSAMVACSMQMGLTSVIMNPNDKNMMRTIKCCDVLRDATLYSDSFLDNWVD